MTTPSARAEGGFLENRMLIAKVTDYIETSPPSTAFVIYPQTEADRNFMAELVDLPGASRFNASALGIPSESEQTIKLALARARTNRIQVETLASQLQMGGQINPDWESTIGDELTKEFVDVKDLAEVAFFVRTYHF